MTEQPEPTPRPRPRHSASGPDEDTQPTTPPVVTTTTTTTTRDTASVRWLATERVAVSLALAVGLLGVAIPYGAHTPADPSLDSLSALEWGLSILALISAVTLLVEIVRPLHPRLGSGYALMAATFLWSTIAVYFLLLGPTIGWAYAASETLRGLAWAALALYEWRRVTIGRKAAQIEQGAAP